MRGDSLTSYCTSGSVGFSGMVWTKVFKFDVMHCTVVLLCYWGLGCKNLMQNLQNPFLATVSFSHFSQPFHSYSFMLCSVYNNMIVLLNLYSVFSCICIILMNKIRGIRYELGSRLHNQSPLHRPSHVWQYALF